MRNPALIAGMLAIAAYTSGCTNKGQEMADEIKAKVEDKIEKGEVKTEEDVNNAMTTVYNEIAKEKGDDYKITKSEKEKLQEMLEEYKKELHTKVKEKWGGDKGALPSHPGSSGSTEVPIF